MKKYFFYTTLALVFCSGNFAQVLFSNSLNNLTLQSYTAGNNVTTYTTAPTVFDLINDGYGNNVGPVNNPNSPFNVPSLKSAGWAVAYNSNVNDTFLVSSSWLDDNSLTTNEWILTPTVNVSENVVLTWLAMSPDSSYRDGYEVYGTHKTGILTPADFTIGDRLFALSDGNTSGGGERTLWTRRSVLVDTYTSQPIRFAFRNNSKDMYQLWIDDIEIKKVFFSNEAQMSQINTEKYFLTNTEQTVGVNVTSYGAKTINTLVLNYRYDNSPVNSETFVIPNGLNYLQSGNFNFSLKYSFSSAGYYPVKSWISSVNGASDQNLGTDTIKTYVTVQSSSPQKNVMLEQFVSAYHGDSPDAQDKAWALQGPSVIQINIHDLDSLKESNSVSLLTDYKKDFATAMIDRVYQNDLLTNAIRRTFYADRVNKQLAKVTPASVSVINKTYNTGTKELSFTVKADFVGEVKGDYRINAYLIERHVYGPGADSTVNGYNQLSNYFNVPWSPFYQLGYFSAPYNAYVLDAWRYKHQNVLVHSFDGSYGNSGVIPANGGTQGQSFQKTFTLTVPTSTNGVYKFNSDNLYIVGFVAEYNADKYKRNILNVTQEKVTAGAEVVGITERELKAGISIYPNPCAGIVYLDNLKLSGNYKLKIYDILGKCVAEKKMTNVNATEKIDLSGLPNGIFVIEISSGSDIFREKIILQGN